MELSAYGPLAQATNVGFLPSTELCLKAKNYQNSMTISTSISAKMSSSASLQKNTKEQFKPRSGLKLI